MLPLVIVATFAASPQAERDRPTPQQQFEAIAERYDAFRARTLCTCPPAELKRDLKELVGEMQELQRDYTAVVSRKDARWAVAALVRISEVYGHAADAIEQMPVPAAIKDIPDAIEVFRAELGKQAAPLRERAAEAFGAAEAKAKELNVVSPELDAAHRKANRP